tara:strand:+ start:3425 stop:4183 length:759 start_codon:yes stop_codon:yes gene_type:complete
MITHNVALFVTCLVDFFRPSVGLAAVKLLESHSCTVSIPKIQTCCGQPAYNSGDRDGSIAIAKKVISAFADYDYVVVPSGSCAGMIIKHYPDLFADDPTMEPQAHELAERTYELITFLTKILKVDKSLEPFHGTVTYHHSCSSLRELGIRDEASNLLRKTRGVEYRELKGAEQCCGFGGTFCIKYPEVSVDMVARKTSAIAETGAQTVLSGDLGCLLNIAGRLRREGSKIEVRHIAEILAGIGTTPAIGQRR